jgi:hypothetical protein
MTADMPDRGRRTALLPMSSATAELALPPSAAAIKGIFATTPDVASFRHSRLSPLLYRGGWAQR